MTIGTIVQNADYISFALLSLILFIPRARFVRLFVALFAGVQLARVLTTNGDETSIAWTAALLGVALLLMTFDLIGHRRVRLTSEEQGLIGKLLQGVSRTGARHFIDQGFWLNGQAGDVLISEGEAVRHLYYLADGEARVIMAGKQVGSCKSGDLIGELTLFSGETASATVVLAGRGRFWCAPAERLRPYLDAHASLRRAIERSISAGLKEKLKASNRRIVETEGAVAAA